MSGDTFVVDGRRHRRGRTRPATPHDDVLEPTLFDPIIKEA